jgi:hypothetical protein
VPVPQSCTAGRRCGVPHADNPSVVHDTNPLPPRPRCVYTIAILVPLVGLALVAALGGDSSQHVSELPGGGVLEWIYPRSAIREVVAYAGVALWLLPELRRRTPDDFRRTLWRAPMIIAIANFLLPAPFVLVHGVVRELFAEQAWLMGLRFLVRICVGYGYVALVE